MSKLFVSDDEEEVPSTNNNNNHNTSPNFYTQDSEQDDPVVSEMPIILTSKSAGVSLNVMQYPGRPPTRPFSNEAQVLQSRMKPSTNLMEVDVPIETGKFFDVNKSDEWGGVDKQTLSGVLCQLEGYYVARVENGELIMCALDKVAQLRPSLSYIDKEIANKREMNRLDHQQNTPSRDFVQVVQMSVKGTSDSAPRLGGALMARKKVEEEEYTVLPWVDSPQESAGEIREESFGVVNKEALKSSMTEEEYLDMLVKETIVHQS